MTKIHDVASYILTKLAPGRKLETVKLQKLLFFCQGWSFGIAGEPLFDQDFEAWKLGPVNKEIYGLHAKRISVSKDHIFCGDPKNLTVEQRNLVDAVLAEYGGMGTFELVRITHAPGSPWFETHQQEQDTNGPALTIDKKLIHEFFKNAAKQRQERAHAEAKARVRS